MDVDCLPKELLPSPKAMLWPELQPILTLRFTGEKLKEGSIPASSIKRGIDGAYAALKKLAEAATQTSSVGRPDRASRQLFDWPTQRLAFGSVELAFARPKSEQPDLISSDHAAAIIDEMGRLLAAGLQWSQSDVETGLRLPPRQILEALEKLTPSADGLIENVEISGQLLANKGGFVLTSNSGIRIKEALRRERDKDEPLKDFTGFVREFDKDKQSFILRDQGRDLGVFTIEDEDYEKALDFFSGEKRVRVIANARGNTFEVLAIGSAEEIDSNPAG